LAQASHVAPKLSTERAKAAHSTLDAARSGLLLARGLAMSYGFGPMIPFIERILKPFRRPRLRLAERLVCEQVALGTEYGGYAFCPTLVNAKSVVYSFGVGCDVSFDQELIALRGVTVHAFDPTPRSIEWVKAQALPKAFVFHPWGIAGFDGTATFHPPENPTHVSHTLLAKGEPASGAFEVPVFRLKTIMDKLGHDRIDILKMDVEGAEYGVLEDVLGSDIPIAQILIEFHHHRPEVSLATTQKAIDQLERAGFRAFHESRSGYEFSFLRADLATSAKAPSAASAG
jgi:FkbM family methyltransferase